MNLYAAHSQHTSMSIEEFFDWTQSRPERYELVEGVPRLQPWVKRNHNRITVNIVNLLGRTLDTDQFEIATGDFAISTAPNSIRYADVLVERVGGLGGERTTDSAILIVEVLSHSTAANDFGRKQHEYLALPTLDTYLIVAQDSRCIWQWTRDANGKWPEDPLVTEIGDVEVSVLGLTLPLVDIYRNVS